MNKHAANFDEARWRRLSDAAAAEEPLSDSDRRFVDTFEPRSLEGRAEAQLFAALAGLGGDDGDADELDGDDDDSPLVEATVQHVLATRNYSAEADEAPEPSAESSSTGPRRGWALLGLSAAAAVAALWWGLRGPLPPADETSPERIAAATAETSAETAERPQAPRIAAETSPAPEPDEAPPTLTVRSGRLLPDAGEPLLAAASLVGAARVDSDEGCVGLGQTTACLARGARVSVGEQPDHLAILEGRGTIVASPEVTRAMFVEIAGDHYSIDAPVTIETTVYSRSSARVTVVEGTVTLVDADGKAVTLEAGETRGKARPSRPVTPPDAKTLLSKARASRSSGDRAAAISYYEKLRRFHPDSAVTKAALVSLGDLYLDARKPSDALKCFSRYLDKGGALAQEAHIGRIKALAALGRTQQHRDAIEAFRKRYPSSRYADQLGDVPAR